MTDKLAEICATKRLEVAARKPQGLGHWPAPSPVRGFEAALRAKAARYAEVVEALQAVGEPLPRPEGGPPRWAPKAEGPRLLRGPAALRARLAAACPAPVGALAALAAACAFGSALMYYAFRCVWWRCFWLRGY